jgi:hypothetical protein
MTPLGYLAHVFTGALLCNATPHLTSGLQGRPFPTPFATPHGVGDSSPLLNVVWGLLNLFGGLCLLLTHPVSELGGGLALIALGALAIGVYLALHFGKIQRNV